MNTNIPIDAPPHSSKAVFPPGGNLSAVSAAFMGFVGEPRFCKDCAHYAKMAERSHMECGAAVDLVTGKSRHADPYYMRENETECGRLARYFKPKEPVK